MLGALIAAPNVVGIKDSSGDAAQTSAVLAWLAAYPDFHWFEGNDALAAQSLLLGAHGVVNGGANVFPQLYVALYEAARGGEPAALREAHRRLMRTLPLYGLDLAQSSWFGSYLKCTKHALSLLGIGQGHCAYPFAPLAPETQTAVAELLRTLRS